MLFNTRITFFDELSVFLLRFPPQFRLILHLLDPDPKHNKIFFVKTCLRNRKSGGSLWPDLVRCHMLLYIGALRKPSATH
jgi:hypothetical protein